MNIMDEKYDEEYLCESISPSCMNGVKEENQLCDACLDLIVSDNKEYFDREFPEQKDTK